MKRKYEIVVLSKGAYARTLRIYAPKTADRAVIMHDGQNAFYDGDASFGMSWRALDLLRELGAKNIAVVGIDSMQTREDDYLPFPNELSRYGMKPSGGHADVYADYIFDSVIPYLEKRFGIKRYAMLGSSAGALATLYCAARRDRRITAYGMFSAPLFISAEAFGKFFDSAEFDADAYYSVYAGGDERVGEPGLCELTPDLFVADAHRLTDELRKHGANRLTEHMDGAAAHNETFWRAPAKEFFGKFSKQ